MEKRKASLIRQPRFRSYQMMQNIIRLRLGAFIDRLNIYGKDRFMFDQTGWVISGKDFVLCCPWG